MTPIPDTSGIIHATDRKGGAFYVTLCGMVILNKHEAAPDAPQCAGCWKETK